jgi:hypothetical protein
MGFAVISGSEKAGVRGSTSVPGHHLKRVSNRWDGRREAHTALPAAQPRLVLWSCPLVNARIL